MGYYTVFELHQVIDVNTKEVLSEDERLEHATQIENESQYEGEVQFLSEWEEVKWYEYDEDMEKYSLKYPNLIFELRCKGEDGAMWNMFVHNGKIKEQVVEIIYNEDYSDLL